MLFLHKNHTMEKCYVLFGSNMGDKAALFEQACTFIKRRCGQVVQVSSAYESEPWGFETEEWFLNRVIVVETELGPELLLRELLDIEKELGRVRHPEHQGYCSRTVDLDILYYGERIINTANLIVPHPRLHLRRFALVPLCEVAPDWMHPVFHKTQEELLQQCTDDGIVRRMKNE
jgi:2-amino-4-hydroxy-6-hydroxymethyldihydropteridine diphosphokinase